MIHSLSKIISEFYDIVAFDTSLVHPVFADVPKEMTPFD